MEFFDILKENLSFFNQFLNPSFGLFLLIIPCAEKSG